MLRTMHDAAVETIATWIVEGRFGDSACLPTEPELGERLGASRTVVREAVKALAAKGMVEPKKRIGTRILPPARWHMLDPTVVDWMLRGPGRLDLVRDLVEIRLAIEPFAAELAAERRDAEHLAAIEAAFAAMAAAVDGHGSYTDADLDFHTTLLVASGNRFLLQMLPVVAAVLRLSFKLNNISLARARRSLPDHFTLLDAVRRGDGGAARRALETIIRSAGLEIIGDLEADAIDRGEEA